MDAAPDDGKGEDGTGDETSDIFAQRRITAICYLNRAWEPRDEGLLRLWPLVPPAGRREVCNDPGRIAHVHDNEQPDILGSQHCLGCRKR